MDIKDWILIGGGILVAALIGHGLWSTWRGRRVKLRMDLEPNVPKEDVDELVLLRGELPNGGARVHRTGPPEQRDLEFSAERVDTPSPRLPRTPPRTPTGAARKPTTRREPSTRPIVPERSRERGRHTASTARAEMPHVESAPVQDGVPQAGPADVIVINVLARNDAKFSGSALLEAFLRNGLKFGGMNIFHRISPSTKAMQFSVASAVEPGTFDLSTMETFQTPGVSFFLRLPGPDEPLEVFEDMLAVCRDVAASLGADLKDEQLSVMTTQTIQHSRSRIEDFSRKRMSQRA